MSSRNSTTALSQGRTVRRGDWGDALRLSPQAEQTSLASAPSYGTDTASGHGSQQLHQSLAAASRQPDGPASAEGVGRRGGSEDGLRMRQQTGHFSRPCDQLSTWTGTPLGSGGRHSHQIFAER
jgi:hypothetical protein